MKQGTEKPVLLKRVSRIPVWARIIISAFFALLAAFGLYWIAYLISGNKCLFPIPVWLISSLAIWLAGFGVRRTGDRLGFGAKRVVLSTIFGALLILAMVGSVFAYLFFGVPKAA